MARHSAPAQLCRCLHEKRQHARGSDLQWKGECRAINVNFDADNIRRPETCGCKAFEPLQKIGKEARKEVAT